MLGNLRAHKVLRPSPYLGIVIPFAELIQARATVEEARGIFPGIRTIAPQIPRLSYVSLYDQRGGGVETSFKGDRQGLGSTKRGKRRFEAQQMVILLGSLAHNVVIWARSFLTFKGSWTKLMAHPHNVVIWARSFLTEAAPPSKLRHYGIVRMVRDVFHVSGFLVTDALGQIVQNVLNQAAPLASA